MKKKVHIDLSELPRYEKGDDESYLIRQKEYQRAYQDKYRQAMKKIRISVTEEEYSNIKKRAEKTNQTVSGHVMSHYQASEKGESYKSEEIRNVMVEMGRIGTNINQIARALNKSRIKIANKGMLREIEMFREDVKSLYKGLLLNKPSDYAKD